jgi:photosystem II stability/assembly factor-like uncharacterized protein
VICVSSLASAKDALPPAPWTKLELPKAPALSAVWGSGPKDLYLVGAKGTILHSSDGTTFVAQTSGTKQTLWSVWGTSASDVYAVGNAGTLLHTTDGGTTWTTIKTKATQDLHVVWGTGPKDVWAAGCALLHSTDGGATFVQAMKVPGAGVENPCGGGDSCSPYTVAWGSAPDDIWLANGSDASHTTDGGKTWEYKHTYIAYGPHAVAKGPAGQLIAVGTSGLARRRDPGDKDWKVMPSPSRGREIQALWISDSGTMIAGVYGNVVISTDDAKTWTKGTQIVHEQILALWGTGSDVFALGTNNQLVHATVAELAPKT